MSEVFRTPHLSAEVKVLLLAMAVHMDEAGRFSVLREEVAAMLDCSERRVTSKQKAAIDAGYLSRASVGHRGHTAEFQAEIPGTDRGTTGVTQSVPIGGRQASPNRGERVTPTSTLSPEERVTPTSTLSSDRGTTGVTQRPRKGDDRRPPTTYTHAEQSESADAAVVASPSDEKNDQEKKTNTARNRASDRFDEFWSAYPRRVGKGAARKAWAKALKNGADPDEVIWGARAYANSPRRAEADIQYTAHPATWLNAERWDDEPEPAAAPSQPRRPSTADQRVADIEALRLEMLGDPGRPSLNIVRGELA